MVKEKLMERYDWQQRTALLLGEEKMERIRNAHVLSWDWVEWELTLPR